MVTWVAEDLFNQTERTLPDNLFNRADIDAALSRALSGVSTPADASLLRAWAAAVWALFETTDHVPAFVECPRCADMYPRHQAHECTRR